MMRMFLKSFGGAKNCQIHQKNWRIFSHKFKAQIILAEFFDFSRIKRRFSTVNTTLIIH